MEAISRIINHPALRHLPFYLETPNDLEGYAREISLLKELYKILVFFEKEKKEIEKKSRIINSQKVFGRQVRVHEHT